MKNFEHEYREMIQEEMPDLWERIENGLEKKEMPTADEKPKIHRFVKYSALAAACLCGVIILPVLVLLAGNGAAGMGGSFSGSGKETAQETELAAETEMAAAADTPAETEMAAAADTPAETETAAGAAMEAKTELTADAEMEAGAEMTADADMTVAADMAEESEMTADAQMSAGIGTEAASAEEESAAMTDKKVVLDTGSSEQTNDEAVKEKAIQQLAGAEGSMTVNILSAEVLHYHTVYTARVMQQTDDGNLSEQTITFFAVNTESEPLETGKTYTVTLEHTGQGQIPLRLKGKEEK